MGKGWTRRPSAVDRAAFDLAFEATFAASEPPDRRLAAALPPPPRKRRFPAPDGCEIASVMTEGFHDQRGEA